MLARLSVSALLLLALPALAQAPPGAPPPPPRPVETSRLIDVEVHDKDAGHDESAHFVVAVSATGATSLLTTTVGDAWYSVKVRRDGPVGLAYALEVERRVGRKPPSVIDLQLTSTATLDPGRRAVVGTIARPDGGRTDVALTLATP